MAPSENIAFIGGGNMARSLIGGLIARGARPGSLRVAEPVEVLRESLLNDFGVQVFATALEAAAEANVWVLAVKPQVMRTVCEGLAELASERKPLLVSIAAGITATQMQRWLGGENAIVRAMPNTPALLGAGVTGLFATAQVDAAGHELTEGLLSSAGTTVWIEEEEKMDAVTAVSGSGPAYFFLLMECMEAAALELGLPAETARALVLQTAFGAARMAQESGEAPAALRKQVTSPHGTTAAALAEFEVGKFDALVKKALTAARDRGRQLAREAGEEHA
jgi:pyrroline-5-carboxylate reductase